MDSMEPAVMPKSKPGIGARPLYDALISAIADSGLSAHAIARASGISPHPIGRFARGEKDIYLASAEKLSRVFGLMVASEDTGLSTVPKTPTDALLSAIARSGLSANALAIESRVVHGGPIRQFVRRERDIKLATADKLLGFFGFKAIRGGGMPEPSTSDGGHSRPITESLLSAIARCGLSVPVLATKSGVGHGSICRFVKGVSGLSLASVEKLFSVLGLMVAREDSIPESPSVALLSAIARSGLSQFALARATGLDIGVIRGFVAGEKSLYLETADRLLSFFGFKAAPHALASAGEPDPASDKPLVPWLDELRSAIKASGLSRYALAKRSRLSVPTIGRIVDGSNSINESTITKLSNVLGLDFHPATVQARSSTAIAAPHRDSCPVEMCGQGNPPKLGGVPASKAITPALFDIITAMVDLHRHGKTRNPESVIKQRSGRGNPVRSLTRLRVDPEWRPYLKFPPPGGKGGYGLGWPDEAN